MIKNLFKYPTTYLFTITILYSVYDYFEHIGRSGSTFEEHPWYWLFFSISAILTLIFIVLLTKKSLEKALHKKNLLFEVIGIGIWLALYLSILGPIINKLFWPFDTLHFGFKFGPFFIVLIVYFVIRLIINLVIGKNGLYSQ